MRAEVINKLRCPSCHLALGIKTKKRIFRLYGYEHVIEGILACSNDHNFPIMEEVPRLLKADLFTPSEINFLSTSLGCTTDETFVDTPKTEIEREIALGVKQNYNWEKNTNNPVRIRAINRAIEYELAEYRGVNKTKYLILLKKIIDISPQTVLDIGGNFGGTINCFIKEFQPKMAVVVDLNIQFMNAIKTPGREICLIRADARHLPFLDGEFDLVTSAFLLEHVDEWKIALREITRVGRECFIAFGPNSWFPFEIGHLDAPLVGTVPKSLGKYIACAWQSLKGEERSLKRIEKILADMSYISSRAFVKECCSLERKPVNLFPMLVQEVITDTNAPLTAARKILRTWPKTSSLIGEVLVRLGLEPQMYFYLPATPLGSIGRKKQLSDTISN